MIVQEMTGKRGVRGAYYANHEVICDYCEDGFVHYGTYQSTINAAKARGWCFEKKHKVWSHYCPKCLHIVLAWGMVFEPTETQAQLQALRAAKQELEGGDADA
jgi:hypothetical protein